MKILSSTAILLLIFMLAGFRPALASDCIEQAGDAGRIVIPVAAAAIAFIEDDREGAVQFLKSFSAASGVTYALKYTVHEKAPDGRPHAFPSGHSAMSFVSASYLHSRYGLLYGLPAYAASAFVGYSRLEARKHRFQDVFAGALIGIGAGRVFTGPKQVVVNPVMGQGFSGIMVTKRF